MAFNHIIATHRILGSLSSEQVDRVVGLSRELTFKRKHIIFREGEASKGIYLIIDGYVKLNRVSSDGRDLLMGLAGPDDLFGSCCQPMVPCSSPCVAEARTNTKAIFMPFASWQWLMQNYPEVSHVYLQALMDTRSSCSTLAADLAFLSLEARLAKLLVHLSRWSRERENGEIEIPKVLSQWELASAIGTAREVVTRKLQDMVESGAIDRRGRQIVIRDREALLATR